MIPYFITGCLVVEVDAIAVVVVVTGVVPGFRAVKKVKTSTSMEVFCIQFPQN